MPVANGFGVGLRAKKGEYYVSPWDKNLNSEAACDWIKAVDSKCRKIPNEYSVDMPFRWHHNPLRSFALASQAAVFPFAVFPFRRHRRHCIQGCLRDGSFSEAV
ncbi:hypothetical protein OAH22_00230 [bacterium]|nr:hypothetical protein [bacterium]MDB4807258.1 hypothetical protein [bacterium]